MNKKDIAWLQHANEMSTKWQHKKKEQGLCVHCGKNPIAVTSKSRCESCLIKSRISRKKYADAHREQVRQCYRTWYDTYRRKNPKQEISNDLKEDKDETRITQDVSGLLPS